jgi:hypothetical protein
VARLSSPGIAARRLGRLGRTARGFFLALGRRRDVPLPADARVDLTVPIHLERDVPRNGHRFEIKLEWRNASGLISSDGLQLNLDLAENLGTYREYKLSSMLPPDGATMVRTVVMFSDGSGGFGSNRSAFVDDMTLAVPESRAAGLLLAIVTMAMRRR